MFLTHLKLNPSRRDTRRLLASPQRIHATVLAGIPDHREGERVLWRLDEPAPHDINLLIASHRQPDLTGLVEQAGWPVRSDIGWTTREYERLLDRLAPGQTWRFRLRANPVVRRRDETGRVHSIPHLTVAQQRDWLVERSDRLGVRFPVGDDLIPHVTVSGRRTETFSRRTTDGSDSGRRVTITSAQFDGVLEVVDPSALRSALVEGVGRAKAYGCGLLTVTTAVGG